MITLYIILGLVLVWIGFAVIVPKSYQVNRSIIINEPEKKVFNYIKYVKNQDFWSPWQKKDPNMKKEFLGTDGEVGFVSKWQGNKAIGEGEQEIKSIEDNFMLKTELRFAKPRKSKLNTYIRIVGLEENQTNVTWGFSGENPFSRYNLILLFNFKKTVGKDFEKGLNKLKTILEQ